MQQNTEEWLEWRKRGLGSSDLPIIMGKSSFETPLGLWETRLGLRPPFEGNAATEFGKKHESRAVMKYTEQTGIATEPRTMIHPEFDFIRASLDGFNENDGIVLEVKCPYGKAAIELAAEGEIPEMYQIQMQHQMLVAGVDHAHYWCYDVENSKGYLIPYHAQKPMQDEIIEAAKGFWDMLKFQTPPPLTDRDYLVSDSKELEDLVADYRTHATKVKDIEKHMESVKKEIKERMTHTKMKVLNCLLYKSVRKGNIDYKAIPELEGLDLESYRGKPSITFTIKESGSKND